MEFGYLGPLYLGAGDGQPRTAPTAPKLRNVLAMLIVNADRLVPVPALMRELWGDIPPASGLTTLQTYVMNLRRMIARVTKRPAAEVAGKVLVTSAGGYIIQTDGVTVDARLFQQAVAAGRAAEAIGRDGEAVRHYTAALQLWRGSTLMDVGAGIHLSAKRRQLEEMRLLAIEHMVDAQLRMGMSREVLSDLAVVTAENPIHEGLHAQYMRALHQSGRRAHSLEVFHRLRGNLVNSLGLEPGPVVQELHQAILRSDADLSVS
jgi:SARP family transcriptional regulator, regulator of embCAB operon